jgi:ribonuclease Z
MLAPADTNTVAAMLGSGKPEPTPNRFGPGGAVVVDQTPYIIDAGEGIFRAIAKSAVAHDGKLIQALDPSRLTRLFITHLHSDHTAGLVSLLLLTWTCGKTEPLDVYGPIGTKKLVETILEAYRMDIEERVHGPEKKDDTGWRAHVHEILEPGICYQDERVEVAAFHHQHGGFKQNFAYRFTSDDRVIVWSGDGVSDRGYLDAIQDADIVFSDVGPAKIESIGNTPWRGSADKNLAKIFHMQSQQLGEIAEQANVKTLVLHHEQNYSDPYDPDILLKEVKQHFGGNVFSARDGDIY